MIWVIRDGDPLLKPMVAGADIGDYAVEIH
jgi:hypothetical protein